MYEYVNRAAAEAAMARTQKKDTRDFNSSIAAIKLQVKRELDAEKVEKQREEQLANTKPVPEKDNSNLAVKGVYFRYKCLI